MAKSKYEPSIDDGGYHIKITASGPPERLFLLGRTLSSIDNDWPYYFQYDPESDKGVLAVRDNLACPLCGGAYYRAPRIMPKRLRLLASQLGCHIKVRSYRTVRNCVMQQKGMGA